MISIYCSFDFAWLVFDVAWMFFYVAWISKKNHTIVVENEPLLLNYYGVIPINPIKCPDAKVTYVKKFVDWLTSSNTKKIISEFRVNNKQLFFPVR